MDSFKRILSYAFKEKRYIIITLILIFIETSVELFIPFIMSSLIDDGVKLKDMNHIYLTGSIIVLFAVISIQDFPRKLPVFLAEKYAMLNLKKSKNILFLTSINLRLLR